MIILQDDADGRLPDGAVGMEVKIRARAGDDAFISIGQGGWAMDLWVPTSSLLRLDPEGKDEGPEG
tara:strand:+ start:355 stop:552 length:198 start_codon:yes stop_codon:yes gene_type:complete